MPDIPIEVQLMRYLPIALAVIFVIISLLIAAYHSAKTDDKSLVTVNVKLSKKKRVLHHIHGSRYYTELCFFFVTEDGDLLEFHIDNSLDFDFYNEGDTGTLTYQGTRLVKFERTHVNVNNNK